MGLVGHIAVYFVIWWTALFAVLPFGVLTQADADDVVPGSEPGAPVRPRLWLKFLITTVLATAIWGLYYTAYRLNALGLSD